MLVFTLGAVTGQKLMIRAYDPATLEEIALQNIRSVFSAGCNEGISIATGNKDSLLFCIDLADKTVKDQEEILRNKIWGR
jgi:hypothetical protein